MAFRILLLFTIMLSAGRLMGQDSNSYRRVSGVRYGYSFNRLHDFQIGYGRIKTKETSFIGAERSHGYFINLGYGINASNSLLTTKLSYDFVEFIFAARLSLVNYTDLNRHETLLQPEVGLSFSGFITLTYGYQISLTEQRFDLSPNSVNLTFTPFVFNSGK